MNPNQTAAYKNLDLAQQALKSGDKNTARQFAALAAQLAPELEEVWLMMGALASPRGSVAYLEKALKINPQSERAKKGLNWALTRLQKEADSPGPVNPPTSQPTSTVIQPAIIEEELEQTVDEPQIITTPVSFSSVSESTIQPGDAPVSDADEPVDATQPAPDSAPIRSNKAAVKINSSYVALLVILLCLVAGWAAWQFGAGPLVDYITSKAFTGSASGPAWAHVSMAPANAPVPEMTEVPAEPTHSLSTATSESDDSASPTVISTATPENTTLPSATATVPLPTSTQLPPTQIILAPTQIVVVLPSATQPVPTNSPAPALPTATNAIMPTVTIAAAATQAMSVTEAPSPTPLPTDTGVPQPTQYVGVTPQPGNADAGGSGRWIDVDLTHQMIYAYEGNTVVNSFLVSTGTWEHPTVTGQYHVYVKYPYTDMSGPGYYLPNVPNTMYFYQGYAVHGTYWHSNFGTPMSHGCVNLSIPDSAWVFNFASVGTLVNVHY